MINGYALEIFRLCKSLMGQTCSSVFLLQVPDRKHSPSAMTRLKSLIHMRLKTFSVQMSLQGSGAV